MGSDLELKRQDIENDFYKCLARLENVKVLLNNIKFENLDNEITSAQQEEILVDLGRVGELAFKYLLKIKQLELFPNQTYEQFAKSQPIFKISTLKDLQNKKIITDSDLEEIKSFSDENSQPFHNYSYLSLILEKVLPETHNNFRKYIEYKEQSKELIKLIDLKDEWDQPYVTHVIFPDLVFTGKLEIPEEKIQKMMKVMTEVEKNTGDIFTRLRYFYNNQSQKEFNIEEIYKYIESLVEFINGIHENYNILNTNPAMIFGKLETKKHTKLLKRTEEEIDEIFKDYINKDPIEIENILHYPMYSLEEAKEITAYCKEHGLYEFEVFSCYLNLEEVKFFINHDIYDCAVMSQILYKEDNKRRTLEEVEDILKEIEFDKYDNLCLLGIFTIDEIKELNKHEKLETFLIEHYYDGLREMLNYPSYRPPIEISELLKIEEIKENPSILYSLDYGQISIHNKFISYLNKVKEYHNLFSTKPLNMLKNIQDNIKIHAEHPELLYSIPLMLDPEEINEILILLFLNGLDTSNLDNFNSTILCMPSNYVYAISNILANDNIPLIKDNNVSREFYEYSNMVLKAIHDKINPEYRYFEPFRNREHDSKQLKQQNMDRIRK